MADSSLAADATLIAELGRRITLENYDERVPELDSEAIDFEVASEPFSELRALRRQDLAAL